jgi:hypothetical protein
MAKSVHVEAIELLLSAIYRASGLDGKMSSFLYGQPGSAIWERRFGVEIFYRRRKMVRAALYVRQNGPAYLRYLSISEIWAHA